MTAVQHQDASYSAEQVLGFEDAGAWQGPGVLGTTTTRTEGAASLAVQPSHHHALYVSSPISFTSGPPRSLRFDLRLPPTEPNPHEFGKAEVYLECPSAKLHNAHLGEVKLTGLALGTFHTLTFPIPSHVQKRLASGCSDLQVKIELHVPGSSGVYYLDNLRILTELAPQCTDDNGSCSHAHSKACQPEASCAVGTRQTAPATHTSPVQCASCDVGTYCAGDTAAPVSCGSGTWDDDANPTTPCVAWKDCFAGQYVSVEGGNVADRVCADCTGSDTTSSMNALSCSPGAWILSYFGPRQDVPNDSLHLAYSLDGLHWKGLGYGQPVYQLSSLGTNHIRDPYMFRKNDGTFVYIATDWTLAENSNGYWDHPSPRIFVADSTDLVTFTNPRLVTLTNLSGPNGTPMHAWAPEAYYDASRNEYAIIWSGNDTTNWNRIYVSYTKDFTTILNPTPDVFFDPGYPVIDGTIARSNGRSYLFFKGEQYDSYNGLDIQIARAPTAALDPGSFERWSPEYITRGADQGTRRGTEGPFALWSPVANRWVLYADYYGNGGVFGAWTTPSLDVAPSTWTELTSSEFRFPTGVRHANTVRVTRAELDALIARDGIAHRLRTSYSEGGVPFYVAHSWYHGLITPESDRSRGQLQDDFLWKVVPGLADPSDPSLVSFESIDFPGRYLRIDSKNPWRYPACNEGSNRGWALCWLAPADRHHLTWVDASVDTPTFRGDVTFRRTAAQNGDPSMVSLQWYSDPSRYLRHMVYQLFATPLADAGQRNDASFVIERE